jgi:hypothetical protein
MCCRICRNLSNMILVALAMHFVIVSTRRGRPVANVARWHEKSVNVDASAPLDVIGII